MLNFGVILEIFLAIIHSEINDHNGKSLDEVALLILEVIKNLKGDTYFSFHYQNVLS